MKCEKNTRLHDNVYKMYRNGLFFTKRATTCKYVHRNRMKTRIPQVLIFDPGLTIISRLNTWKNHLHGTVWFIGLYRERSGNKRWPISRVTNTRRGFVFVASLVVATVDGLSQYRNRFTCESCTIRGPITLMDAIYNFLKKKHSV